MTLSEISLLETWVALGGAPLIKGRGIAFWRAGVNRSVKVDAAKGWHDHVEGTGGGTLALVETVLGVNTSGALAWLEENMGLTKTAATQSEQRARERQRAARLREIDDAESFGVATLAMTEEILEDMNATDLRREFFVTLRATIRRGGDDLVNELKVWREKAPEAAAALIRAGAESRKRQRRRLELFIEQEQRAT